MNHLQSVDNINALITLIKSYGLLGPAVAFALFIIQAVLPVFPYMILATAGGILFGFKLGFFLAWSGALIGACLAYWVCRIAGTERVIKTVKNRYAFDLREFDRRFAFWSIVLARILPVVPTPIINATAALTGVPFWVFFFSSAIGKLPTALLYTGLGLSLFQIQDVRLALLLLGVVLFLLLAGHYLGKKRLLASKYKSQGKNG